MPAWLLDLFGYLIGVWAGQDAAQAWRRARELRAEEAKTSAAVKDAQAALEVLRRRLEQTTVELEAIRAAKTAATRELTLARNRAELARQRREIHEYPTNTEAP